MMSCENVMTVGDNVIDKEAATKPVEVMEVDKENQMKAKDVVPEKTGPFGVEPCGKCEGLHSLTFANKKCSDVLCYDCVRNAFMGGNDEFEWNGVVWKKGELELFGYSGPQLMEKALKENKSSQVEFTSFSLNKFFQNDVLKFVESLVGSCKSLSALLATAESEKEVKKSPPRKRARVSQDESGEKPEVPAVKKETSQNKLDFKPMPKEIPAKKQAHSEVKKNESEDELAEIEPEKPKKKTSESAAPKPKDLKPAGAPNEANPSNIKKVMKKNVMGETKLHEFCKKGNIEKACEFLEMGSDPNTSDNANIRPIHEHRVIFNPELVALLLKYGAQVNVVEGNEGLTPLHIAVTNNCIETARLLIKHGADIHFKAVDGNGAEFTPLSLAERLAVEFKMEEMLCVVRDTQQEVFEAIVPPVEPIKEAVSQENDAPLMFSFSSLSEDENNLVQAFVEKFENQLILSRNYSQDCNLLLCGKNGKIYPPSTKLLAAVMCGGNVVDIKWAAESSKNRSLLDYQPFLLNSIGTIKDGVAKARRATEENKDERLFTGMKFYIQKDLQAFTSRDLRLMVELGSGELLNDRPKAENLKTIMPKLLTKQPKFLDSGSMINDMRVVYVCEEIFGHIMRVAEGFYKVSPDWVVNCVASYSILPNIFPQCQSDNPW